MSREPALDDDDRQLLLGAVSGAPLPAGRADALWQRVLDRTASASEPPARNFTLVKGSDDDWREALPGLHIKPLRVDEHARTQTSLWRLAAGARVPAHSHHAEEECLILEGTLVWGDRHYVAGDFLLAHPGGAHDEFTTPDGAVFLIRSELTEPLRRLFAPTRRS